MSELFDLSKNIPTHFTIDYFQKIFARENKEITNVFVETASKPGDNFVGAVYRVFLTTASHGKKQYVIKVPSNSSHETFHSYLSNDFVDNLFHCEMEMYGSILPEILKLWKKAGYKDLWCPRLIHQTNTPNSTIILEDVSLYGFTTLQKPIENFETSKLVVSRLAKFHAGSYYLVNEKRQNFSNFVGNVFRNPILCRVIYSMGLKGFIYVANTKPALRKYVEKLQRLYDTFEDKINELYEPSANGINVLCHNDFHLKNLLVKMDKQSEEIEDLYAIDFQLCNYTSPAFDIIYSLYYFVSPINRRFNRNEFIKTYYDQFITALNDFGFTREIPSLKMLEKELTKCAIHEILTAICLSIFYYFDLTSLTLEDLDMAEGTMKAKYRMYENQDFLEMIVWQLQEFEDRRIL